MENGRLVEMVLQPLQLTLWNVSLIPNFLATTPENNRMVVITDIASLCINSKTRGNTITQTTKWLHAVSNYYYCQMKCNVKASRLLKKSY